MACVPFSLVAVPITVAPCVARFIKIARPIPRLAPVTKDTFSVRDMEFSSEIKGAHFKGFCTTRIGLYNAQPLARNAMKTQPTPHSLLTILILVLTIIIYIMGPGLIFPLLSTLFLGKDALLVHGAVDLATRRWMYAVVVSAWPLGIFLVMSYIDPDGRLACLDHTLGIKGKAISRPL